MKKIIASFLYCTVLINTQAQCPIGQTEVSIDVTTDAYGYEIYWELVPSGNNCGVGTLFAGGNVAVGCNGGSLENQLPGGYANNITVNEGPWCLNDGFSYDIIFVDDWGDNGATFTVNIAGFPMYVFNSGSGAGVGSVYTFTVTQPLAYDIEALAITTYNYVNIGNVAINAKLFNKSSNTITSIDVNYQIDNGTIITAPLSGLTIPPFTDYSFTHPIQWNALTNGTFALKIWASNLNGNVDMDNTNDTLQKNVTVGPGIPNLIDSYIGIIPQQTIIANASNNVLIPRDLDFHPTLVDNELWIILKNTAVSGGSTVKILNAGEVGQTSVAQQDGNAVHFMSLPTGIAFSENENFATSPGVFDANHNGGAPFTGPTLWSSDPLVYAQPSGGNGSHLDMLHESPYSMGIASEADNIFWVNDGNNNCVTRYDFKDDHGPGNSDHSDAIVRRYTGLGLVEDPTRHIASHLVLDKTTNWLYIVDTGNDRILRMDITTGSQTSTFVPYEDIAESSNYTGYTSSVYVSTGLIEPSGIDIIGNRMIVSDHASGEIIIYDIAGSSGVELGRIVTGAPGIMGVKIGPDGKIWYVNATTNQVVRLEFVDVTGIKEVLNETSLLIYPNPTSGNLNFTTTISGNYKLKIIDIIGREILNYNAVAASGTIDVSEIPAGNYFVQVIDFTNGNVINKKISITH